MAQHPRLVHQFLSDNGFSPAARSAGSGPAALHERFEDFLRVTQLVSKIPWGEARTIEDVLRLGMGTCTGKHLLLAECYDMLGIPYSHVVTTFAWEGQPFEFSKALQTILQDVSWPHEHNYLRVITPIGNEVDIDITWDPPLAAFGFPALPENWDAEASFIGVTNPKLIWTGNDGMVAAKKQLTQSLSPAVRHTREVFLALMFEWVDTLRRSGKPAAATSAKRSRALMN